jgi:hypothetical protein
MKKFGITIRPDKKLQCSDGTILEAYCEACLHERKLITEEVVGSPMDHVFCLGVSSVLTHLGMTEKVGVGLYDMYYLAALQLAKLAGHEIVLPPSCPCCSNLIPKEIGNATS